jgi:HK97 gp10 family phage protein
MADTTELIGLKEANAALRRLPEFAKIEVQIVIDVTAYQVAQGAIARAPEDTGRLKHSITNQSRPRTVSSVVGIQQGFITFPYYWKFIEYGTVKMGARPMFRPAAMAVEGDHQARLEQALLKAANRMERAARSVGGRFL